MMITPVLLSLAAAIVAVTAIPPPPPFPDAPPPALKKVVPSDVYNQLLAVHQDKLLTVQQKIKKLTAILEKLPDDVWAKLPPPPGFEKLPPNIQAKIREIHLSRGSHKQRVQKFNEYVKTLPVDQQRLVLVNMASGA